MSTEKQISANQINAEKSTGPKSEAGKAISCQNACKHGLFGHFQVLATEDQSLYNSLLRDLLAEYTPETPTESILVENMAQHHWLRQRALYFQHHYIESGEEADMRRLSLYMRYETMHERAYHKCLNTLLKLRADKQKQKIGFVSQAHKERMQELNVLCREADVRFHETRALAAEVQVECKNRYEKQGDQGRKAA